MKELTLGKMAQMDMELKKVSERDYAQAGHRVLSFGGVTHCFCFPQAFTEMQINKLETTKKINMIDMKCDMVKTGKHKYQLTEKGTSNLSDDTRWGRKQ